jgi:hypothetical protein
MPDGAVAAEAFLLLAMRSTLTARRITAALPNQLARSGGAFPLRLAARNRTADPAVGRLMPYIPEVCKEGGQLKI